MVSEPRLLAALSEVEAACDVLERAKGERPGLPRSPALPASGLSLGNPSWDAPLNWRELS